MEFYPEGYLLTTSRNTQKISSIFALSEAAKAEDILEGRALLCDGDHNLIVELGSGIKGIMPREECAVGIETGKTRDIAIISRVNKAVCFTVVGFETIDNKITPILSRKKAQEKCKSEYHNFLTIGDVICAKVTHMEGFGCFVDIGCGIPSMIPIDAISVSRISHPKDRFVIGQNIKAIVKIIEENGRICLTHKELLGTWQQNAELFSPGETVAGIIRSVEPYGAFVELTPNLAGLAEPRGEVKCSQHASVYIKSLLPAKMKVKLIIIDAFEAPYPPKEMKYFYDKSHIDVWRYSPEFSPKVIETVFN